MRINISKSANRIVEEDIITMHGNLDMNETLVLREEISRSMAACRAIAVDAGAVARVGTPALQVLLAGYLSSRAEGISFRIASASDALRSAFEDVGLLEEFNSMVQAG